jgi:putative ABC transport system ATP-binding protein
VEEMLFGYNRNNGVTLIIVTHDADLAKKCDILIHIKDGKIESMTENKEKTAATKLSARKV